MKCRACPNEYPAPDIIDGTAYFVCSCCGDYYEVENYRIYTPEERMEIFEKDTGFKLPKDYLKFSTTEESWVVKVPPCESKTAEYYFGDGFYEIGDICGLDPEDDSSIFDSSDLVNEWGLPKKLVLIEGDGHTWLALDYRASNNNPKVIVIETDEMNSLVVSNDFNQFMKSLLHYESVYDSDGVIIYEG